MKVNPKLNHTGAHLLAASVLKLYPGTKIGIGPAIDEGFYYDFAFEKPINDQDLVKIEKQMKKLVAGGYKMQQVATADLSQQPFKTELKSDLEAKGAEVTYYGMVNPANNQSIFSDLCAGNHVTSVSELKHFKLLSQSAAYWKGDAKNASLTRIYGTAWETAEELAAYLKIRAERKERDHRKIGKEMKIFMLSPLAGQGFPIYLQAGMIIKNQIQRYIRETEARYGFTEVQTPAFGAVELYKKSGHWAHYKDDMYQPIEVDNETLVMRPMTCPHHVLIYNSTRRSYRDLPIRLSEQARLYRYEKSGALLGLERVRSMELTEGHVFCRHDQIKAEMANAYALIKETLAKFAIEIDYVSLSLRDPKDPAKYFADDQMWDQAENDLRAILSELKIEYQEMVGEAAFYGPKIDFQVKTALGHEITLSTLQLDFLLPKRFEAYYINEKEEKVTPVLLHRGLIGTYERFIAILLEQTKGDLPFWLAPKQVVIMPVNNDKHLAYAANVLKELKAQNIRATLDERNERLGKKIREAQLAKVKWQVIIGDTELANNTINIRAYGSEIQKSVSLAEFKKMIQAAS